MEGLTTMNLNAILTNVKSNFSTLLLCPVRFSGDYDGQKLKNFIEYIEHYKRIKCISDEQALHELGNLLTDSASTWWLRRKCKFSTWSAALIALQDQFSKQRPAYLIYKDIFEHSHVEYTHKEDFVNDKYELLSELSEPKLSEKNKLHMICALLSNDKPSEIQYSNISSLMDLKEKILTLKCHHSTAGKQGDYNGNNSQCGICEINDHEGETIEEHQPECLDIPYSVYTATVNDPIIMVRCTEDLMPQVKEEENEETTAKLQEEFLSTENILTNYRPEENTHFQIDTDIMNQINSIIDESEMDCNNICDKFQISSNEGSAIAQQSIQEDGNTDQAGHTQIPLKKKKRCSFCRARGHSKETCLKIAKKRLLKANTNNTSEELNEMTSKNINVSNISPLVANVPPLTLIGNHHKTQLVEQHMLAEPSVPTVVQNTSVPSLPPKSNHTITLTQSPPVCGNNNTLTAKLIAPINGPGSSKLLSTKLLRNINEPLPKCHQCGNVGYYKSICPNCSPIYNCKPNK